MKTMYYSKLLKPLLLIIAASFLVSLFAFNKASGYKLIIFEGSDWCVQCIRLEEKVLSDSAFTDFIKSTQIELERIDFPQRKRLDRSIVKYNDQVAERYEFDGTFPTLLLTNAENGEVHKISYSGENPKEFITMIRSKISSQQ